MYTATTKQILQPVAEAIAALIVLNAEADAIGAGLPDLSDVAQVVDEQARNLVKVGMDMLNQNADDLMKKEMPPACHEIEISVQILLEAASEIKFDSFSKKGRAMLVDAAKGILQGTTHLLDAYDDGEVRKIVNLCASTKTVLSKLDQTFEVQQIIAIIKPACQQLVDLTALANRRVDELLFPALQTRLRDAIQNITKTSNLVVSSSKAVAQNSKNQSIIQSRSVCLSYISELVEEISKVVQIRDWVEPSYSDVIGQLVNSRGDIRKQLGEIMQFAQEGKVDELQQILEAFNFTADGLTENVINLAESTRQPAGPVLKFLADQFKEQQQEISLLSNMVASDPSNVANQESLYKTLQYADAELQEIAKLSDQTVAADLQDSVNQLKDHQIKQARIGEFYDSVKEGGAEQAADEKVKLNTEVQRLVSILDEAALLSPDAETFNNIRNAQKSVKQMARLVEVSGLASASLPNDKQLGEHFNGVVKQFEDDVQRLEKNVINNGALFPFDVLVQSNQDYIDAQFDKIQTAVAQNDDKALLAAASNIVASMKRMVDYLKFQIENTSDPKYKQELQQRLQKLEGALSNAQSLKDKLEQNPSDASARKAFMSQQQTYKDFNSDLQKLRLGQQSDNQTGKQQNFSIPEPITPVVAVEQEVDSSQVDVDDGPKIVIQNGEEVEIVNSPAPEILSEEEAKLNPIKAAAQDLKVQASQYSASDNPVVELMQQLALKMEAMSALYKQNTPQSKADMMKTVQNMQVDIQQLLQHGKNVKDNCTDKSLKLQLSQAMERMQTLSVQLKIVAAVKIAEPKDIDSEKQLILCSQNLMAAVKSMLKASEAASLRAFKTTANVAVAMIKFRKVLYKKGGGMKSPSVNSPIEPSADSKGGKDVKSVLGALSKSSGSKAADTKPVSLSSAVKGLKVSGSQK
ncbi:hypothetical protein MIR68_009208 [Amoeboaphelidium protococcarum]|nr:hypothetical protein MIR68_009208 [Amoeboaphelidium protococcarum]